MGGHFKCGNCNDEFDNDWSELEADKEAEMMFGVKFAHDDPDMVAICDECFTSLIGIGIRYEGQAVQ